MPFKIKLSKFVSLEDKGIGLNPGISAIINAKGVPIKVAYDLSKIGRKLAEEIELYGKKRFELIKEFGTESENDTWTVQPEKLKDFAAKHDELMDHEVEIGVNPIKLEQLGDKVEGVTAAHLAACHDFILDA